MDVQETAQRQTAAILQKHSDLKGIFGTNLFSAQGAYQAVSNAGLAGTSTLVIQTSATDPPACMASAVGSPLRPIRA